MSWLKRQRELRRLKKRFLRECKGRVYVVLDSMDPNYDPPSTSVDGGTVEPPTCTVCRQQPGDDCRHFVARP